MISLFLEKLSASERNLRELRKSSSKLFCCDSFGVFGFVLLCLFAIFLPFSFFLFLKTGASVELSVLALDFYFFRLLYELACYDSRPMTC